MPDRALLRQLTRYTQWADDAVLTNAAQLPVDALEAERDALFGSIAGTFDHILVVAEMFDAHLEERAHRHTARRRAHPALLPDQRPKLVTRPPAIVWTRRQGPEQSSTTMSARRPTSMAPWRLARSATSRILSGTSDAKLQTLSTSAR